MEFVLDNKAQKNGSLKGCQNRVFGNKTGNVKRFLLLSIVQGYRISDTTNLHEDKWNIHIPHPTVKYTMIETFIFVTIFFLIRGYCLDNFENFAKY